MRRASPYRKEEPEARKRMHRPLDRETTARATVARTGSRAYGKGLAPSTEAWNSAGIPIRESDRLLAERAAVDRCGKNGTVAVLYQAGGGRPMTTLRTEPCPASLCPKCALIHSFHSTSRPAP